MGLRPTAFALATLPALSALVALSTPVANSKSNTDGKTGAGLLFLNDEFAGGDPHALILKRAKESNHGKTWSLPGGNYDPELDRGLYETALREAREELGSVPDISSVRGSLLVRWGEDDDNEFTVFLVETSANKGLWQPELDVENTDSKWISLKDLDRDVKDGNIELHPMLQKLTGYSALDILGNLKFDVA